jgi:hypothetical protein
MVVVFPSTTVMSREVHVPDEWEGLEGTVALSSYDPAGRALEKPPASATRTGSTLSGCVRDVIHTVPATG